jgi:hypothetical protein
MMVQKGKDIFILYSTQCPVTHFLRDKGKDKNRDHAVNQVVSRRLPTAASWADPRSGHVEFVVDEVSLGQVFFEYLGFLWARGRVVG